MKGGIVQGNKITANAGRMSIESEQDKKNYKETSKTSGLSVSYTPGSAVSVSGGKGQTNTDSTYESVTKQTGIYAGKEGYDIQVKNNTRLKGAGDTRAARQKKNKRITTGTLTWENIDEQSGIQNRRTRNILQRETWRGRTIPRLLNNSLLWKRRHNRTKKRNGQNHPNRLRLKIPLNERGLLNTPIPSVKEKQEQPPISPKEP
ncbi:MAG: hemagglutinin repeat-containing protein [Dialister invisus]